MSPVAAFSHPSAAIRDPRQALSGRGLSSLRSEQLTGRMIDNLRRIVLAPPLSGERFFAVFMDANRSVSGIMECGKGHIGSVSLSLRELFTKALALDARYLIVAHNHPSGDCRPSSSDLEATHRVAKLANAMEIELIDHLIFTTHSIYSIRGESEL